MPADVHRKRYEYKGYSGCASHCELRLFRDRRNGDTVAVVTELDANEGTSVTNMAEGLAAQIIGEFSLDPQGYVQIEHYPATLNQYGGVEFEEEFSRVRFTFAILGSVQPNSAEFESLTATEVAYLTCTPVKEWADAEGFTESDREQRRGVRSAERERRRREIVSLYRRSLESGDIEGSIFALDAAYAVSADDPEISDAISAVNRELAEEEGIEAVEGAGEIVRGALARFREGEADAGEQVVEEESVGECARHGSIVFVGEGCPGCGYERRNPEAAAMYDRWLGRPQLNVAPDAHLEGAYEERTEIE